MWTSPQASLNTIVGGTIVSLIVNVIGDRFSSKPVMLPSVGSKVMVSLFEPNLTLFTATERSW